MRRLRNKAFFSRKIYVYAYAAWCTQRNHKVLDSKGLTQKNARFTTRKWEPPAFAEFSSLQVIILCLRIGKCGLDPPDVSPSLSFFVPSSSIRAFSTVLFIPRRSWIRTSFMSTVATLLPLNPDLVFRLPSLLAAPIKFRFRPQMHLHKYSRKHKTRYKET